MTQGEKSKLRVWWIPQFPMKPFRVYVDSVAEAVKIMDVLAEYDKFQFDNKVKPDYSNAGGLEMYSIDEWEDWHSDDYQYDDPNEWLEDNA